MNNSRMMFAVLATAVVAALVIGCLGCGGGSSPTPPPPPAPGPSAGPSSTPAATGGGAYDPAKATATIRVKAAFKGTAPKFSPTDAGKDKLCAETHPKGVVPETLVVDGDKLANVIAYVSKGAEKWTYTTPTEAVVLDQKGCTYHPHVFTVMTKQPITIKNSDETTHNIHAAPTVNKNAFNFSQIGTKAKESTEKFDKEEVGLRIKCDIHGWMESWVGVFGHPFHGVTGADGTVSIKVPAGEYEISAWHEYGRKLALPAAQKVTVGEGETKDLTFEFAPK